MEIGESAREKEGERESLELGKCQHQHGSVRRAVRASNVALPIPVRFSFSLDILEKKPESVPIRGSKPLGEGERFGAPTREGGKIFCKFERYHLV